MNAWLCCILCLQSCNLQSHVVSAVNLTTSFALAEDNVLMIQGTNARGLVADSDQNMFPFRNTTQPIGRTFVGGVVIAAVGNCGGAALRGSTGTCQWTGGPEAPTGSCEVKISWKTPSRR